MHLPPTTHPAHADLSNRIGSREAGCWSVLIVAVAFWANIVRGTGDLPGLDTMVTRVLDHGAFDVFAWTIVFARTARMFESRPATWLQISMAFLVGAIVLAPVRVAAGAALGALGVLLLTDRRTLKAGRDVGLVLLALAFETIWTSQLLDPLQVFVGRADAVICAILSGLLHTEAIAHANVVDNLTTNFSIAIYPACASSFPLAGVGLAFLVMCLYQDRSPRRHHVFWLGLSFIASILLTEIRLVLLATSRSSYHWWHDGPGVSIYALTALSLAVLFPILATWNEPGGKLLREVPG
jgi:hypothetical protein